MGSATRFVLVTAFTALSLTTPSLARWKPQYADLPQSERAWYNRQTTTPEWRARVGRKWYESCCDHGDVVDAEFSHINGKWNYRLPGTTAWVPLPDDVVQADVDTPHSKPVLFVDATGAGLGPVCFFPGGTGT